MSATSDYHRQKAGTGGPNNRVPGTPAEVKLHVPLGPKGNFDIIQGFEWCMITSTALYQNSPG